MTLRELSFENLETRRLMAGDCQETMIRCSEVLATMTLMAARATMRFTSKLRAKRRPPLCAWTPIQ